MTGGQKLVKVIIDIHVLACLINPRETSGNPQDSKAISHDVCAGRRQQRCGSHKCHVREKKPSFHVSFTPPLCGLDVLEQNHFSLLTVHTEDSEDGCRYLGEVLRRLVGRQPSPGSASSLPPGRGSQTGFSGWCGCKKKKKSSSDLRGETWKTHTITQCYVFKLYTTLAAVNGYPGDMLPPIALE